MSAGELTRRTVGGLLWTGGLASGAPVGVDSYVVDVLQPEDETG